MRVVHAVFAGEDYYGIAANVEEKAKVDAVRKHIDIWDNRIKINYDRYWSFMESEGYSVKQCKLEEIK